MPLEGFEPTIPVSQRPQTHALDRMAAGMGHLILYYSVILYIAYF
jgi:hypothetical protein